MTPIHLGSSIADLKADRERYLDAKRDISSRFLLAWPDSPQALMELTQSLGLKFCQFSEVSRTDPWSSSLSKIDVLLFELLGVAALTPGAAEAFHSWANGRSGAPLIVSERLVATEKDETQPEIRQLDRRREDQRGLWNLRDMGIPNNQAATSRFALAGRKVRIAVLDTGLDSDHEDFDGRATIANFVSDGGKTFSMGEDDNRNGHGTKCIGLAAGPFSSRYFTGRYGVACEAEIFSAKVLNQHETGCDLFTLAGLSWALENKCQVASMSQWASNPEGSFFDPVFEWAAKNALRHGCLLVAAAGNGSNRLGGTRAPVAHPASCPSVMAVAALEALGNPTVSSNAFLPGEGSPLDLTAPGDEVVSSVRIPLGSSEGVAEIRAPGTSWSTAQVAGIAALYIEHYARKPAPVSLDPSTLREVMKANAIPVADYDLTDVGHGLVQAP